MLEVLAADHPRRGKALRLWGYRLDPQPADEASAEFFACAHTCRRQGTNKLDLERQAAWCCALPGYDRRAWRPYRLPVVYMGAPPRFDREGINGDWNAPHERPDEDGCPGAWYRTAFLESVLRYRRRPNGNGGRVPNRLLDLCDDELVIEAVEQMEAYEDAWRSEWLARRMERAQAEG